MTRRGIPYPMIPLPARHPDQSLNEIPIKFAKLNVPTTEPVALYGNILDASTSSNAIRFMQPGELRYVAFTEQAFHEGGQYVKVSTNEWVRASPAAISYFQGLQFNQNPPNEFGWIVEQTSPRYEPNYRSSETGRILPRESVIQIFDTFEDGTTQWYMIGLNEWVEHRYARVVTPAYESPKGVDNQRWIEINLYQQTISAYEEGRLLFSTLIATGVDPYFTQPGLFKIYEKKPTETMSGAFAADKSDYYYLDQVPWTMYYDQARALHGAYWRTMYGYPQSHGCVNMSIGDARWLYDWADVGDWVYVWDPSGQTPTDPNMYTEGGA
jgi:hypothetical protein